MTKLLDKRFLRITALTLAFLFLMIGALGASIVEYGFEDRWYRPDTGSFEDTIGCEVYVNDALYYIERNMGWLAESQWNTFGSYAGNAFSYIISGPNGIVANTLTQQSIYVSELVTTLDGERDGKAGEYTIEGYVNLPVGMYDGCYREYLMFDTLFAARYWTIALTALFFLLAVLMMAFATASAVRAGKRGELRLIRKIPFDVVLVLSSVLFVLCSSLLKDSYVKLVGYYTNYTGFMLINNVVSGISIFCWGGWLAVLVYFFAAQFSAKTLKSRLLITTFSRKISISWLVAVAVCIHFALLLLILFDRGNSIWIHILTAFDACLLLMLVRFLREAHSVRKGAEELAGGNLTHKVNLDKLHTIWWSLGGDLNKIGDGMASAVEERMRSERMKTELITNVSHDLKTPLTSIINYIHFLKDDSIDGVLKAEYLEILDRQSAKLKKLTEDIVEASKAASGVISVNTEILNAGELLEQSVGEYAERMRAVSLEPVVQIPEAPVNISADSNLLGRILENLMTNIIKYAQSGTRVYFDLSSAGENVVITVKNISRAPLNISAEELMERFVRGDSSRHSEGSGLGLSIARSLTELMGGQLVLVLDGDLFKAEIHLKKA